MVGALDSSLNGWMSAKHPARGVPDPSYLILPPVDAAGAGRDKAGQSEKRIQEAQVKGFIGFHGQISFEMM